MNHREMAHRKMQGVTLGVLDANTTIWQTNAAFSAARNQLDTGIKYVDSLQTTQAGVTTGVTEDKTTVRQRLAAAAVIVAGAVAAYADSQNNHELFAKVDFTAADLKHGAEEKCQTNCTNILQAGKDNLAALVANNTLAQSDLDTLETESDAFGTILTKPRQAKAGTKSATNQLPAALLANDRTLERQLDKLMEKYRVSNPDYYQKYQVARIIVDIGAHPSKPTTATPSVTKSGTAAQATA